MIDPGDFPSFFYCHACYFVIQINIFAEFGYCSCTDNIYGIKLGTDAKLVYGENNRED